MRYLERLCFMLHFETNFEETYTLYCTVAFEGIDSRDFCVHFLFNWLDLFAIGPDHVYFV
jgi:hypothetical protein